MAKVTIIPSKKNPITLNPINEIIKKKVAAYARVSTDSDEQFTSFYSQCKVYEDYIKSKPDWEFVKVYADDGISGTNTKNRVQFNQMIEDALAGKIDLIVTKSISRFARNTLDTISYTRKLKANGIEVYFEKENLWTFDDKAEFLLAIMSSIAQEESRSISQNVTMGKRWKMQEGKVQFAYKNFLGYKKEDGQIKIDDDQAVIVKLIYKMFLVDGKTCSYIANYLNSNNVLTPARRHNWSKQNVLSILKNEKYKGDAILQKSYIKDFLEHKAVKNNGELPKYYVENSHPAIIEKDMWEMVQAELKRRELIGASYSSCNVFSSKLICGDCEAFYGKKVWHSNDAWRKEIFQCNKKFAKGKTRCQTPSFSEQVIKDKFIKAYNLMMVDKNAVVNDAKDVINKLTDTTTLDVQISKYENEMEIVSELVKKLVKDNSIHLQDQNDYEVKYQELVNRHNKAKELYEKLSEEKKYKQAKAITLKSYLSTLENADTEILEWNDALWMTVLDKAIVNRDETITFKFINGKEITL